MNASLAASLPTSADLIIEARWIIPVEPAGLTLDHHAIVVSGGKILAVLPQQQAGQIQCSERIQLPNHVLIPGLVNSHGHSPMALFRGIADDIPLQQWLQERIWPLESEYVNREFVHQGTMLAVAEFIRSGQTCFADNYFFPNETAAVAQQAGIRAQFASPVLDFPTSWAENADEYIAKTLALHDELRNDELLSVAFGPHAPYTVSDAPLLRIRTLAEELDLPIHMHVHENATEVSDAVAKDGRRPLERLHSLGLLSPRMVCVHATQLSAEEVTLLADTGSHVVHCPESNLKLASGLCEVDKLMTSGVNVAIGTDGAASNNDLSLLGEIQTAAMLAKGVAGNAAALPAAAALEMATINGARALGLEEVIGSLVPGKSADIAAIDLAALNTWPVNNPLSHLVYAVQGSQVSHVWCSGKALLRDGELTTLDVAFIKSFSQQWSERFSDV